MYRQLEKNLLSSNVSPTCPHNMVNFLPLAAEIVSLVWGSPGNFNGFHVLAVLLHGTLVVDVSQTAALNRGRHLYSTGRPSRWAFAHISSFARCWLTYYFTCRHNSKYCCIMIIKIPALLTCIVALLLCLFSVNVKICIAVDSCILAESVNCNG